MSAAALATSALLLGLTCARRLPVRATWPERLATGALAAVVVAAWVTWLAVLAVGYDVAAVAAPSTLLLLAVAPAAVDRWRLQRDRTRGIRHGVERRVDDRRFGERRFRDRREAQAPLDASGQGERRGDRRGALPDRRRHERRGRERRERDGEGGEAARGNGEVGAAPGAGEAAAAAMPPGPLRRRPARLPRPQPLPRRLRPAWLLVTVPTSALLVFLLSTHFLPELDGGWGSAGSTWGDLALHATLAARVSQQEAFEWTSPVVAGAPLTYPFLPDFLSGVLHRWGWSLRWGLLGPSILVALALVQLLFFTGWRAGRARLAAVAVVLLMLFDGSAAALPLLWEGWRDSGAGLLEYLSGLRHDATHVPAINLRFSNLICDALLPQRGMLVGLAALLAALPLLRAAWTGRRRLLVPVALLLGALPFVHVHTFLVLAGLLAWLAVARGVTSAASLAAATGARAAAAGGRGPWPRWAPAAGWRDARWWLLALLAGLLVAAPQLAWQLSHAGGGSFSKWRLGWMAAPGESPVVFWLRNLGVLAPFLAAAPFLLRRWHGAWLQLCAAMLMLFPIANVYVFQPHEYDNLKLLFYAYLALVMVTARLLARWWRDGGVGRRAGVVAVLVLGTVAGGLSVLRETTLRWPFLAADEVELGMALRGLAAPDALFLTADRHNHPVPIVAGRPIVLGYRGWLWTHGIDASRHLHDVQAMYRGGPEAEGLLRRYGVDYVVVGPHERQSFEVDEDWLADRFRRVLAVGRYRVYGVAAVDGDGDAGDPTGDEDDAGGAASAALPSGHSAAGSRVSPG